MFIIKFIYSIMRSFIIKRNLLFQNKHSLDYFINEEFNNTNDNVLRYRVILILDKKKPINKDRLLKIYLKLD